MNIVFPIYILYTKNKNPGEANLPGFYIYIYMYLFRWIKSTFALYVNSFPHMLLPLIRCVVSFGKTVITQFIHHSSLSSNVT